LIQNKTEGAKNKVRKARGTNIYLTLKIIMNFINTNNNNKKVTFPQTGKNTYYKKSETKPEKSEPPTKARLSSLSLQIP